MGDAEMDEVDKKLHALGMGFMLNVGEHADSHAFRTLIMACRVLLSENRDLRRRVEAIEYREDARRSYEEEQNELS